MLDVVMTIDDDSMGQMLSEIILSDQQFCDSIVKLYDGKMALDYFEEQSKLPINEQKIPSLVLLDINMPILDGWDFLNKYDAEFKRFHSRTKIIVLTSSLDPNTEIKAVEHPLIFKYIAKPLENKHIDELKSDPTFCQNFN
ncbi:MAG: response regulator [Bacteroidetes bacterium]|nr:response regulator [Bacteroidota bacterium]